MPNKPHQIAFLHTAAVHEQTFAALLRNANVEVTHHTQPAWLAQAQAEGLTTALANQVLNTLQTLAQTADAVVCTCTTLGPLVDALPTNNVFRIDYPMMSLAATSQGRVLLVLCLESTVSASTELLERAYLAEGRAPNYEVLRCTDAWTHFENNKQALFEQVIADRVVEAVEHAAQKNTEFACVVLGQASMASAASSIIGRIPDSTKVLRSPPLAVMHALLLAAERTSQV